LGKKGMEERGRGKRTKKRKVLRPLFYSEPTANATNLKTAARGGSCKRNLRNRGLSTTLILLPRAELRGPGGGAA